MGDAVANKRRGEWLGVGRERMPQPAEQEEHERDTGGREEMPWHPRELGIPGENIRECRSLHEDEGMLGCEGIP